MNTWMDPNEKKYLHIKEASMLHLVTVWSGFPEGQTRFASYFCYWNGGERNPLDWTLRWSGVNHGIRSEAGEGCPRLLEKLWEVNTKIPFFLRRKPMCGCGQFWKNVPKMKPARRTRYEAFDQSCGRWEPRRSR